MGQPESVQIHVLGGAGDGRRVEYGCLGDERDPKKWQEHLHARGQ